VTPRCRGDRGQAAVELALVLPVVMVVLLLVVQVGLVLRDQLLVVHAAREAARAASVGDATGEVQRVAQRAGPLVAARLHVSVTGGGPGSDVEVDVRYRSVTDLPLVGPLVPDVDLTARAVMRHE
jgi:Flp pilus assembly protein TadG